jgi:hypothetical protein
VRDFAAATTSVVYRIGPEHRDALLAALGSSLDGAAREVLAVLIDPRTKTTVTGARGYNVAMLAAAGSAGGRITMVVDSRTPDGNEIAVTLTTDDQPNIKRKLTGRLMLDATANRVLLNLRASQPPPSKPPAPRFTRSKSQRGSFRPPGRPGRPVGKPRSWISCMRAP